MKLFKLTKILSLLLIISLSCSSCMNDDVPADTISLLEGRITAVSGPETANINTEISLTLTFNVDNNCGRFNRFITAVDGNTKTVILEAVHDSQNCNYEIIQTTTYKFKETKAGTYVLKFKKSETEYITKTIVVS